MTNAHGRRPATSLVTAGLLVGLIGVAAPIACGGEAGSSKARTAAAVTGDVATLSVFLVKDSNVDSDQHTGNAFTAVRQSLGSAGYRLVKTENAADVFARIGVSKEQEKAFFQVQINGKTSANYKVSLIVQLVDRDGKEVARSEGSYSSSEGEADHGEVASIIDKLSESPALAQYATSTKGERAERAKKAEVEEKKAAKERRAREKREADDKARAEAKERAQGTIKEAEELQREIEDALKKAEGPIPDDKLTALKKDVDKLKGISSDDGRYFQQLYTTYALENAWWAPEGEGPANIAKTLSSDLVSGGMNDGKKLNLTFNVKAGSCYTVFLRYKVPGGQEEIKDLRWSARAGNTVLQRYYVPWGTGTYDKIGTQRTVGTCATKDTAVTLTADLVFAGTKNGLRYAVISSPKAKFPAYLATYLSVDVEDPCDTDAWYSLWADPIPGSIVYSDKEPYILERPDRAGQLWVNLLSATKGGPRAQKKQLASAPPKKVKFSTQFRFPGCSKERAEGADSVKLAKCHAAVDARYKAQWDAATHARDNAITFTGRRAAEAQLNRLNEADDRDREQQCKPIEAQIAKKWETTFNKIVDTYTESPHKSSIDRADELWAQDRR